MAEVRQFMVLGDMSVRTAQEFDGWCSWARFFKMSFKLSQIFNVRASICTVVCFIQHLSINFCNWSMVHNRRSWTEASDSQQLNLPQLCKTPIQWVWTKETHVAFGNKKVFHWAANLWHPEFYLQCGDGCSHGSHEMGTHGSLFPAPCPQQLRKSRRLVGLIMFDRLFGWGGCQPYKMRWFIQVQACINAYMNFNYECTFGWGIGMVVLPWWCIQRNDVMLKQHSLLHYRTQCHFSQNKQQQG